MSIKRFALQRLNRIDTRSLQVYRNIVESVILKGASVLIGFVTVTLTVRYIPVNDFGIWMTITFLTNWFSLVDVSFGNGLRNNLVLFFTTNDETSAREHISTLYFLSALCALGLCLLFGLAPGLVDWTTHLHITSDQPARINAIITYTLIGFSLQLALKPINSILLADQRTATVARIMLLINALIVGLIYLASVMSTPSLLVIAHITNIVPLLVFALTSVYFFRTQYARVRPSIRHIRFELTGKLLNISGQFFFLQLISVLVFTSGGLFISYFLGSADVAPFSIANKYFSVLTFLYGIVITPYWSAFTDACVKQDIGWIQNTMRRLNRLSLGVAALALLMFVVAQPVFAFWIGPKIPIPISLCGWLTAYVISFNFLSNYNYFVNGAGQLGPLVRASLIGAILYVPLNYLLFRYVQAGPASVVIAGTIWNCFLLIVCAGQYRRFIHNRAQPPVYADLLSH
ncbi:O-antigen/teichoic acid export membrane protein [Spirosoma lacussanchae]|uniref:lipopolysaccharide biosynthesis protein n=1 Tax=Spirosoma lacussanchae TaxID=1884249 RepID=UPI001107E59E|nr:oligosaccharide flippase family protein [Spirosoma lacussanchae]